MNICVICGKRMPDENSSHVCEDCKKELPDTLKKQAA